MLMVYSRPGSLFLEGGDPHGGSGSPLAMPHKSPAAICAVVDFQSAAATLACE